MFQFHGVISGHSVNKYFRTFIVWKLSQVIVLYNQSTHTLLQSHTHTHTHVHTHNTHTCTHTHSHTYTMYMHQYETIFSIIPTNVQYCPSYKSIYIYMARTCWCLVLSLTVDCTVWLISTRLKKRKMEWTGKKWCIMQVTYNNNNNVHLSCTNQCPEHSHDTH